MIEATNEMVSEAVNAAGGKGGVLWIDEALAVVAAVLAIVERDYVVRPRTVVSLKPKPCGSSRWGMPCDRPDGHPGNHLHTESRSWA